MAARYEIHTDGSCLKNPNGPGGWACVITNVDTGDRIEISGGEESTTNNRMELTAALQGLLNVEDDASVVIFTDSQYVYNIYELGWVYNWIKNNWISKAETPVVNKDLIEAIEFERSKKWCHFVWVRGHCGNKENECCDKLAVKEAMKFAQAPE